MLQHLRVTNLGVLEDASIEPVDGLTVITGETGAGKTLLLGGLRLMLGEKPDSSAVGPFSDQARADGLFVVGETEIGVTRVVPAAGRSRAYVDGSIVAATALSERVGSLVEIVGQHDQLSLKRPSRMLALIDAALDADGVGRLTEYKSAWQELQEIRRRQTEVGGNEMALRQELDLVRFQTKEIENASLVSGEDAVLENEASRHRNAFEIGELLGEAAEIAERVADDVGKLVSRLRRVSMLDFDRSGVAGQSEEVAAGVAELVTGLRRSAEQLEVDPERAETIESRLTLIGDLKRKYGRTLDEVILFGVEAEARREELFELLQAAERLESDLERALARVAIAGSLLTESRERAAARIAGESRGHLADLGLEMARLDVEIESSQPGSSGVDDVTILFSSDDHLPPGTISTVASGGELSRLVLSVRLATRASGAGTLVFDEVDSGVGGATALAMGRKLAELAETNQVLCVTHLPQVAAFADLHYVVERTGATAQVRRVSGDERLQEISRMLAGLPDSEAGQSAAAELIAAASN